MEQTFGTEAKLYPNPTDGAFTIDFGKTYPNVTIEVFDGVGKLVFSNNRKESHSVRVDLKGMAAGRYAVKVTSGEKQAVFKVEVR